MTKQLKNTTHEFKKIYLEMTSGHKKKAKKHEWEAHKNNLDLKKF